VTIPRYGKSRTPSKQKSATEEADLKVFHDPRLADPFLRPFWRHERVLRMLEVEPNLRCKRYDDNWICGYKPFLKSWREHPESRDDLMYKKPALYYAHALFERASSEPQMAIMIESRLLAGASVESIADDAKTMPEAIEWYEKLFFNVSPFLSHHDWIMRNVLVPAFERFTPDAKAGDGDSTQKKKASSPIVASYLDLTLKLFAYFGGPIICDVMISGFNRNRKVQRYEDVSDYLDEQFKSQIARRSAQAAGVFEVNQFNVMELFATHQRIIEVKQSLKGKEEQRNDFEKHVNAMLLGLPWLVGGDKKTYKNEQLRALDDGVIEANSKELIDAGMCQMEDDSELKESAFQQRRIESHANPQ